MFPTADPPRATAASSFCATYTTAASTATTGFPDRFTSACGSSPSKYSSACSCAPTATPTSSTTPTPTNCGAEQWNVLANPYFECGGKSWRAWVTNGTTYSFASNAAKAHDGTGYFSVAQLTPPPSGEPYGQALLRQYLYGLRPDYLYRFNFDTWHSANSGMFGVMYNGKGIYTAHPGERGPASTWVHNKLYFNASGNPSILDFEFFMDNAGAEVRLDGLLMEAD